MLSRKPVCYDDYDFDMVQNVFIIQTAFKMRFKSRL